MNETAHHIVVECSRRTGSIRDDDGRVHVTTQYFLSCLHENSGAAAGDFPSISRGNAHHDPSNRLQ